MGTNSIHNSTYENDGTGEQREALGKASQCLSALTCIVHKRGAECHDVRTNSVLLEKAVKYEIAPQKNIEMENSKSTVQLPCYLQTSGCFTSLQKAQNTYKR